MSLLQHFGMRDEIIVDDRPLIEKPIEKIIADEEIDIDELLGNINDPVGVINIMIDKLKPKLDEETTFIRTIIKQDKVNKNISYFLSTIRGLDFHKIAPRSPRVFTDLVSHKDGKKTKLLKKLKEKYKKDPNAKIYCKLRNIIMKYSKNNPVILFVGRTYVPPKNINDDKYKHMFECRSFFDDIDDLKPCCIYYLDMTMSTIHFQNDQRKFFTMNFNEKNYFRALYDELHDKSVVAVIFDVHVSYFFNYWVQMIQEFNQLLVPGGFLATHEVYLRSATFAEKKNIEVYNNVIRDMYLSFYNDEEIIVFDTINKTCYVAELQYELINKEALLRSTFLTSDKMIIILRSDYHSVVKYCYNVNIHAGHSVDINNFLNNLIKNKITSTINKYFGNCTLVNELLFLDGKIDNPRCFVAFKN